MRSSRNVVSAPFHIFYATRALLPDLIKFAYIPRNEHRIHGDADMLKRSGRRESSPDFSVPDPLGLRSENGDHVLVLEFAENSKGKKNKNPRSVCYRYFLPFPEGHGLISSAYALPVSLSHNAVKKLIEKRNDRCAQAITEFVPLCAMTCVEPRKTIQADSSDSGD